MELGNEEYRTVREFLKEHGWFPGRNTFSLPIENGKLQRVFVWWSEQGVHFSVPRIESVSRLLSFIQVLMLRLKGAQR